MVKKKINDVEITLSKRSADRIRRRIVELTPRNWGSSIHDGIKKLNRYLKGWFGFFKIVTSKALRLLSNFDAHIRRRLRAMQLHDWGSRRQIVRNLVRLQAKADSAAKAVYGQKRSLWDLSRRKVVEQVLSNNYYQLKGVFSLKDAWLMAHPEKSSSQMR
jgi:RNA-directed DNA polymerase